MLCGATAMGLVTRFQRLTTVGYTKRRPRMLTHVDHDFQKTSFQQSLLLFI